VVGVGQERGDELAGLEPTMTVTPTATISDGSPIDMSGLTLEERAEQSAPPAEEAPKTEDAKPAAKAKAKATAKAEPKAKPAAAAAARDEGTAPIEVADVVKASGATTACLVGFYRHKKLLGPDDGLDSLSQRQRVAAVAYPDRLRQALNDWSVNGGDTEG